LVRERGLAVEHFAQIFEVATMFVRDGQGAEMSTAVNLILRLVSHQCPLILENPLSLLDLLLPLLDQRANGVRSLAIQAIANLCLSVNEESLHEIMVRCSFVIESLSEAKFLTAIMVRHSKSDAILQLGRDRLPGLIPAVEAALENGDFVEILSGFQVLGTFIAFYRAELDPFWPLFLSLTDHLLQYAFPQIIVQIGLIFQGISPEDDEHARDMDYRMQKVFNILLHTGSVTKEYTAMRFAVLDAFLSYVKITITSRTVARVSKWVIEFGSAALDNPKTNFGELLSFLKLGVKLVMKVTDKFDAPELTRQLLRFAHLGFSCPHPEIRAVFVKLLSFLHRPTRSVPYDDEQKLSVPYEEDSVRCVIEFFQEESEQLVLEAAKFLFDMHSINPNLFSEIASVVGQIAVVRLSADSSPELKDYLIGILVSLPDSDAFLELIASKLPIVAAAPVCDRVFRWIAWQWQNGCDNPAIGSAFLQAIMNLFAFDIRKLISKKHLSCVVLRDLLAIIESTRTVVERFVDSRGVLPNMQAQIELALRLVTA
jgi:hypothetical protein